MEGDENLPPGDGSRSRVPRSRIAAASALPRLQELTESDNNAHAATSMPPPPSSLKRGATGRTCHPSIPMKSSAIKTSERDVTPPTPTTYMPVQRMLINQRTTVPEPMAKRKTLAERAGEIPTGGAAAPPSHQPIHSAVKAAATSYTRGKMPYSSNSSRQTSNSSRSTSNSSTSSLRGPAANGYRPQSAMSFKQPQFGGSMRSVRPATSMASHTPAASAPRNGMLLFPRSPSPPFQEGFVQIRRQRQKKDEIMNNGYPYRPYSSNSAYRQNHTAVSRSSSREISLSSHMAQLSLASNVGSQANGEPHCPSTPSLIPKPVPKEPPSTPSPQRPLKTEQDETQTLNKKKTRSRNSLSPSKTPLFLNKYSNVKLAEPPLDMESRLGAMDKQLSTFNEQMKSVSDERSQVNQKLDMFQMKVDQLNAVKEELTDSNTTLQNENEELRLKVHSATISLEDSRRAHSLEVDDLRRKQRNELEDLRDEQRRKDSTTTRDAEEEVERLTRRHVSELEDVERKMRSEIDEERDRRFKEVDELTNQLKQYRSNVEQDASTKALEAQTIRSEINQLNASIEQERAINNGLREKLAEAAAQTAQLESDLQAARAKTHFLESDSQAQSQAFADLNSRMQEAIASAAAANSKLRAEETLRRKLHNQVQELKGNIRVFCRVRPTLESEEEPARIAFPDDTEDCKEIVVTGPEKKTAIGNDATSKHNFAFDRVFNPTTANTDIFEEISQLVQSALDGYNVCIFCYGQTGSGKTYTMSSEDGMIPLAVNQIYETASGLKEKGWTYSMEGSFVEVYNENLNDLLGKADDIDKKKLEIRHDKERCKTTVTDLTSLTLDSPSTVSSLLKRASANRSVAATKANERSSRSHSVFILRLTGENSITGERSEGTLNLVDLAGSERLAHSAATGDRLKETQSINKSLSCLADVISALGQGKDGGHIPYRNSKLTYLLQHSLGGNSKTLMFVMVSPLAAHLGETVTSLKFATKVHNTHIGTAKKQTRVRD